MLHLPLTMHGSGFTFYLFKPPPSLLALATTSNISLSANRPRLYVAADGPICPVVICCAINLSMQFSWQERQSSTSPPWLGSSMLCHHYNQYMKITLQSHQSIRFVRHHVVHKQRVGIFFWNRTELSERPSCMLDDCRFKTTLSPVSYYIICVIY